MGHYISNNVSCVTIGTDDNGNDSYNFGDFLIIFDGNSPKYKHLDDPKAELEANMKFVDEIFRKANQFLRARGYLYFNELCHFFGVTYDIRRGNKAGWCRITSMDCQVHAIRQVMANGTIVLNVDAYLDITPFVEYPPSIIPYMVANTHYKEEYSYEDPFFLLDAIAKAYEKMKECPAAFVSTVGEILIQNDLITYEVVVDGLPDLDILYAEKEAVNV